MKIGEDIGYSIKFGLKHRSLELEALIIFLRVFFVCLFVLDFCKGIALEFGAI